MKSLVQLMVREYKLHRRRAAHWYRKHIEENNPIARDIAVIIDAKAKAYIHAARLVKKNAHRECHCRQPELGI